MKIPSIVSNNSLKLLSGLANNEDSLTSMVIKDWLADGATVYTYKKNGGKDDAREKAIEEFGTGFAWLFGIPLIKKGIDKLVYPIFKLDPNFDPRLLNNGDKLKNITNIVNSSKNSSLAPQKTILNSLNDKNSVLKKFTNAQMYKGMAIGKFAIATIASAFALTGIIKYKQKTTNDRIEKELSEKNKVNSVLLQNNIKQNQTFSTFTSKNKTSDPSFTGLAEFMYNPIKNTMILDGVITTTRLAEARKGERKEVAFKEAFQLLFIYGLAKPIQTLFESIGNKIKCPIELDPKVLFTKKLKDTIDNSSASIDLIKSSKDKLKTLSEMDIKNPLISLLDKNGAISTIKNKQGEIQGINFLKTIDEKNITKTIEQLEALKPNLGNLTKIKGFKTAAVIGNVLIASIIMGVIQPKLNILMRKLLNNGDNRNPAIVKQEEELTKSC